MSTPEPRQSWRQAYIWVLDRVARLYYALCPKVGGNITQDPEWCDMSSEEEPARLRRNATPRLGGVAFVCTWTVCQRTTKFVLCEVTPTSLYTHEFMVR
jgi:hypothetical protein